MGGGDRLSVLALGALNLVTADDRIRKWGKVRVL